MNRHDPIEAEASVFKSNRSQAVRIPKALAFPDTVKKVRITRVEDGLLIKPLARGTWAEYFSRRSPLREKEVEDLLRAVSEDSPPEPVPSFED